MGTDLVRRALSDVRLLYVSLDAVTLTAVNKNRESRRAPRRANLLSDSTYFSLLTPLKLCQCRLAIYTTRGIIFPRRRHRVPSESRKKRDEVFISEINVELKCVTIRMSETSI